MLVLLRPAPHLFWPCHSDPEFSPGSFFSRGLSVKRNNLVWFGFFGSSSDSSPSGASCLRVLALSSTKSLVFSASSCSGAWGKGGNAHFKQAEELSLPEKGQHEI